MKTIHLYNQYFLLLYFEYNKTMLRTRRTAYNLTRVKSRPKQPEPFALGGIVPDEFLEQFPPKVKSFLKSHGDEPVNSIKVCREPINSTVMGVMNTISLGALERVRRKLGVDTFFHLYLLINDKYILEKNQVLDFRTGSPSSKATCIPINFSKEMSINEMVDNCLKRMGAHNFFTYSAFNLNCQNFVKNMLSSNGITPPTKFIDANMDAILKEVPWYLPKVSNIITDLAGALTLVKQKIGFKDGGIVSMDMKDYIDEHRRLIDTLQKHGLDKEADYQLQELRDRGIKL